MLTKDQKARWIAALREPERKQIRGALHTPAGQCCLGVLCQIVGPDFGINPEIQKDGLVLYDGASSHLPPKLECALYVDGFDIHKGRNQHGSMRSIFGFVPKEVPSTVSSIALTDVNDGYKWTFPQIADLLEKYLPTKDSHAHERPESPLDCGTEAT